MNALRLLSLSALLLAAPAAAEGDEPVHVGKWQVAPADELSCQAIAPFGDHFRLAYTEDPSGTGTFMISDDRWQLDDVESVQGTLSWDGGKTSREAEFIPVQDADGHWLLVTSTGSWFSESLAGAKHIWLGLADLGLEEDFAVDDALDVAYAVADCNSNH